MDGQVQVRALLSLVLPVVHAPRCDVPSSKQYSLIKTLAIWASVTP
jgi:hypothetical protein